MEKIRVLVANRPRLMRELVLATISDQPDIEVIGEIRDDAEIANAVAESQPDFLIIALGTLDQRPAICTVLMGQYPRLKVVALAPERNSSIFIWSVIDIQSVPIECSEVGILNALRGRSQLVGN